MTVRPDKCRVCGAPITPHSGSRPRLTCSDKCRKKWSREREYAGRRITNINLELAALRVVLKQRGDLAPYINARLRLLQDNITDLLYLRPDEDELLKRGMLYERARKHHQS